MSAKMSSKNTRKSKESSNNVLEFYFLAVKLKELIRTGWKQWNVNETRLESVAEHIYGTCMLAIAMDSEYDYDVDLRKVIMMLVVHELEEIIISDITPFQGVSEEEKLERGHEAILQVLKNLNKGDNYCELILEFDARQTKESKYAGMCDKLECNLMSLYYDSSHTYELKNASKELQENAQTIELSENGRLTMGECFYKYELEKNRLDANFTEVLKDAWKVFRG